jgi:hypothetical protein
MGSNRGQGPLLVMARYQVGKGLDCHDREVEKLAELEITQVALDEPRSRRHLGPRRCQLLAGQSEHVRRCVHPHDVVAGPGKNASAAPPHLSDTAPKHG